jgi:cell filamentation protein, protein adenylyltransferase
VFPKEETLSPRITGRYERTATGGEEILAFVPSPLPPADPELVLDADLSHRVRVAEESLRRLELAADMVPSVGWFIYAFVRKEAVLSSQIEGTQATLIDLLSFEAQVGGAPDMEVEEVCNYLQALFYARDQLRDRRGLPLSMRLLNETHRRLMQGVRGGDKMPGEVRRSQNWIGGTRPGNAAYVPPPPHLLAQALSDFERYLHAESALPPLVRAGLLHVQFETIHPYLDGNGRIGRLLMTLLLEHWKLLERPLLYLSLFFKDHRDEYYRRLAAVRTEGDWEGWIAFFLRGVAEVAEEAVESARDLFSLVTEDRVRVLELHTSIAAIRLFELLPQHPVVTVASVVKLLDTTKPTAGRAIDALVGASILVEVTGRKRDRSFWYQDYLGRLRTGTDLDLPRVR